MKNDSSMIETVFNDWVDYFVENDREINIVEAKRHFAMGADLTRMMFKEIFKVAEELSDEEIFKMLNNLDNEIVTFREGS